MNFDVETVTAPSRLVLRYARKQSIIGIHLPLTYARTMTNTDLLRFIEAQTGIHDQVAAELAAGRKRSHWMWFVFPQLAGLGFSTMAHQYAISGLDEARRYLADPVLGKRLRDDVALILRHKNKSAHDILGTPDDLKLRSCLTLFREASTDASGRALFTAALDQFYGGKPDPRTLELLGQQ